MKPCSVVCLCGSTRFLDDFHIANVELSKRGFSIITISMALPKNEQGTESDAALKELLDLVHLNKIMRADAVFVVGDGYIGRSTARELLWAHMQGKPIVAGFAPSAAIDWNEVARRLSGGLSTVPMSIPRAVLGLAS